jgi:hypothetical protein
MPYQSSRWSSQKTRHCRSDIYNQNNYHNMLLRFFWSKVVRKDYKKYYFQQDGASIHTSKKAQNYLRSKFGEKFIDKKKWPPRSPSWIHVITFYGVILNQEFIIHCQKIWMI